MFFQKAFHRALKKSFIRKSMTKVLRPARCDCTVLLFRDDGAGITAKQGLGPILSLNRTLSSRASPFAHPPWPALCALRCCRNKMNANAFEGFILVPRQTCVGHQSRSSTHSTNERRCATEEREEREGGEQILFIVRFAAGCSYSVLPLL